MLALFVKVPTSRSDDVAPATFRLRKVRNPFAEPQYSANHSIHVRFRISPLVTCVNSKCNLIAETRFVIVNINRKMAIRGHSKVTHFVVSGKTIRH